MQCRPGDIVSRRKGLVMHRGIVVDDDCVFHNTPSKGEHISSLSEFQKSKRMYVHSMNIDEREAILNFPHHQDARKYNLFTNNCEHTVSRSIDGRAKSPQLVSFLVSGAVATATLVLTRHWGLAAAGFAVTRKLTGGKNQI